MQSGEFTHNDRIDMADENEIDYPESEDELDEDFEGEEEIGDDDELSDDEAF